MYKNVNKGRARSLVFPLGYYIICFMSRVKTSGQAADGLAVLSGEIGLFLPEVPMSDAFIVADVQELMGGDGHKSGGLVLAAGLDDGGTIV